jgi:hypothetical protein
VPPDRHQDAAAPGGRPPGGSTRDDGKTARGGAVLEFWRRVQWPVRYTLAAILLVLAVVGALLPILQGWIFFLAAVAVLGRKSRLSQWLMRQVRRIRTRVRLWRRGRKLRKRLRQTASRQPPSQPHG